MPLKSGLWVIQSHWKIAPLELDTRLSIDRPL